MQDELEDLRDCGLSGCRPKIIQPLANIKVRLLYGEKKIETGSQFAREKNDITMYAYICG